MQCFFYQIGLVVAMSVGAGADDNDGGSGGRGRLSKKVALFLTPAETKILVLISASAERFGVSCKRDFF